MPNAELPCTLRNCYHPAPSPRVRVSLSSWSPSLLGFLRLSASQLGSVRSPFRSPSCPPPSPPSQVQVRIPVGTTGACVTVVGGGSGWIPGTSLLGGNTHNVCPTGRAADALRSAGQPSR